VLFLHSLGIEDRDFKVSLIKLDNQEKKGNGRENLGVVWILVFVLKNHNKLKETSKKGELTLKP